jgi:hypothetical protein
MLGLCGLNQENPGKMGNGWFMLVKPCQKPGKMAWLCLVYAWFIP